MQFARNILNEQRRRLIGNLMQYMERNVYQYLSPDQQRELRARVLQAVGQYHDLCLDMLKASIDDGTVQNDDALRLLSQLSRQVDTLRAELVDG